MVGLVRVIKRIHQSKAVLAVRLCCQREDSGCPGFADINTALKRYNHSYTTGSQGSAARENTGVAKCTRRIGLEISFQLTGC